jgi:hypothetical protein
LSESSNEFQDWIRSSSGRPYYIGGSRFEKNADGYVVVNGARFDLEEAIEIGQMLLSANPLSKMSAQLAIWEKNGTLIKFVLVGTILLLVIALVVVAE